MNLGFLAGIGVCSVLTVITIMIIVISRNMNPGKSLSMIQSAGVIKFFLTLLFTVAIFVYSDIDRLAYALTVGFYMCVGMPIIAFMAVKNETKQYKYRDKFPKKA